MKSCTRCGKGTYITKRGHEHWLYDKKRKLICKNCYDKQWSIDKPEYQNKWYSEHREYKKIYDILTRDRHSYLCRVRDSIKRGYWVQRID